MTRVHVICEGQTEETFINEILAPSLATKGVFLLPSLIGKWTSPSLVDRFSA